jgi:VWFA-related protein
MRVRTVGSAALAVLIVAIGSGLSARPALSGQERDQARPLRHDTAAIVKLVAVRVLGLDGRPVAGLRKEDFRLFEDGEPKTITEFEAHAITPSGMTMTPAPPPSGEAAARAAAGTTRKLFFFLDQQASDRAGKDKALAAALEFLETQVRPGDEIAVLGWYAMSGFYIRQYLTTDLDKVRKALTGVIEAPPSPSEAVAVGMDDIVEEGPEGAVARNVAAFVAGKSATGAELAAGSGSVVTAPGTAASQRLDFAPRLAEIAEIFKTIPGHKSLIIFTARNMGAEAGRLGRLFGQAGTAVFAVNTQDWKMGPFGTKFHYIWTEHSLQDLSAASGGKYFADINAAAAIARDVQDLTGNYYVLGYYVQDSWEGKFHKLRIEVDRPGARVLVQDGFSDSKPFGAMTDFERDVQLLELLWSEQPPSGPQSLPIDPLLVRVGRSMQGCYLTKWDVGAKTGPPAAPVEIFALLRDEKGDMLVSRKWDVDLTSYGGGSVWVYLSYPPATGIHELRLVVRDRRTGEACIGRSRFDASAPLKEGLQLGSPLLFEEGPSARFLRLPVGPAKALRGAPAAAVPSLQGLYKRIPKDMVPVVEEISPGSRRLIAVLPLEFRPSPAGDTPLLSVEAVLLDVSDGSEIPLEAEVLEYAGYEDGPDILAAGIALADILPGRYELVITVEDMGTDRRASFRKALTVR